MATTYPAKTKQAASIINGVQTDAMSTFFSDKIMVTITQAGRLAQWIQVPLDNPSPNFGDQHLPPAGDDDSLLPMPHLSPKTLLGGSTSERETVAQLYATQIASAILTKDPEEKRTVLVGLGLTNMKADRDNFYDIIEIVSQVL